METSGIGAGLSTMMVEKSLKKHEEMSQDLLKMAKETLDTQKVQAKQAEDTQREQTAQSQVVTDFTGRGGVINLLG